MKNKLGLFEWHAFQNEKGWRFSFGYIFPCSRDIQVFASSKLANWRLKHKNLSKISLWITGQCNWNKFGAQVVTLIGTLSKRVSDIYCTRYSFPDFIIVLSRVSGVVYNTISHKTSRRLSCRFYENIYQSKQWKYSFYLEKSSLECSLVSVGKKLLFNQKWIPDVFTSFPAAMFALSTCLKHLGTL